MRKLIRSSLLVAVPVVLLAAAFLYAGPLNPPAGPITSTGKTTQEIFDKAAAAEARIAINATNTPGGLNAVFRIAQPGSYYLTGNVTGAANRHIIEVGASDVTIDLNGFTLTGVPTGFNGIAPTAGLPASRVTVRNGTIASCGFSGIQANSGTVGQGAGYVCENVRVLACSMRGLDLSTSAVVRGCIVENCGTEGIYTGSDSLVESCSVSNTGQYGIVTQDRSLVKDCRASGVAGTGVLISANGTVTNCVSVGNTTGLNTGNGCIVQGCVVSSNAGDGIVISSGSTALQNVARSNGLAGIHIYNGNPDCRIEENQLISNARGLYVQSAGNIVLRNTASGNTTANWDIVANNVYGPIIDRSAPASAAVSGNAAASSLGSTDPNANFTY